jgi:hypothetical protein
VTIASRFEAALDEVTDPQLDGPELLPVRLARACARMLEVDGAGISLQGPESRRIPLGASSDAAARAERLQFTVGDGPCATAQRTRQPVFAVEVDLRRRWPAFADLLAEQTPFRGVVALPLQPALVGAGAVDLLFVDPDRVTDLEVFDAMAVGELVASSLSAAAVWSTWSAERGPEWLHGPTPRRRAAVWEAMGKLSMTLAGDSASALALLRASAYAADRSVDDVAADLLDGRLSLEQLAARG